jgi:hypothetical protein
MQIVDAVLAADAAWPGLSEAKSRLSWCRLDLSTHFATHLFGMICCDGVGVANPGFRCAHPGYDCYKPCLLDGAPFHMDPKRQSFMAATVEAHRDVVRALRAMPYLALAVALILIGQAVIDVLIVDAIVPATSLFGREISAIASNFLLTPFFIAVHRFVVLGEMTRGYAIEPRSDRFLMFFGWLTVVLVASKLITLPLVWFGPRNPLGPGLAAVAAIAACVMFVRMSILFPAIAVDAPGATWRNAVADTKGHGWYIFFLFIVPFIPIAAAVAVAAGIGFRVFGAFGGRILLFVLVSAAVIALVTMAVVIASRLYQALGDRVNQET